MLQRPRIEPRRETQPNGSDNGHHVAAFPDGFAHVDAMGITREASGRQDLTWYGARGGQIAWERLVGHRFLTMVNPAVRDAVRLTVEMALRYNRPMPYVYTWVDSDQAHDRMGWVHPCPGGAGGYRFLVYHLGTRHVTR